MNLVIVYSSLMLECMYTCVVPVTGGLVNQTAGIRLVTGTYIVIIHLSMSELVVQRI